jgi:hypothetical protein
MRLEAAQVIDRRPEDVFRFVATDHFQNHPKWDPAIEQMAPTSPSPMAEGATARLVRRDRGKVMEGIITVAEYEPVHTFAAVSRFGPFTLRQRASLEPVPATPPGFTWRSTPQRPGRSGFCCRCSSRSSARP